MRKFNQLVAIDLAGRLELAKLADFTHQPLVSLNHALDVPEKCDGMLVSIYEPLDEQVLNKLPHLSFIGVYGTSTKLIDTDYCQKRGIKVPNVVDYCDHETAEWVMWQLLNYFRTNKRSLYGQTLGLIGVGAVGKLVATYAIAMGMKVYYDATHEHQELKSLGAFYKSKEIIFREIQAISFHTPAHFSWLNERLLKHLGEGVVCINTCMGRISEGSSLEDFLARRTDVTLVMDSVSSMSYPSLKPKPALPTMAAFDTKDSRQRLETKFIKNIASFLDK